MFETMKINTSNVDK